MKKTYLSILALIVLIILGSFSFLKIRANAASAVPSLAIRIVENNNLTNDVTNTATGNNPYPVSASINIDQTNGVSIYWAGDNPSLLNYASCRAQSSNLSSIAWSWSGAGTNATLIPLNWSTPVAVFPTMATKYSVTCKSLVSSADLTAEITVTPTHTQPTSLALKVVSGTSAPVYSISAYPSMYPNPTVLNIPLGTSIDISWAADGLASPNNTLDPNACWGFALGSGSINNNWSWGPPAYTGTSVVNNMYSTPITDTPTVDTTYSVSCNPLYIVGHGTFQPRVEVHVIVPPSSLALKVVSGTSAPVYSISTDLLSYPNPTVLNIPLGTSVNISWAGDTLASPNNTLDPNACWGFSRAAGGTMNMFWGPPAYTGTSVVNNMYSTPITDTPTVDTTYSVSCSSITQGNPPLYSRVDVHVVPPLPVPPALKLRIIESGNATSVISSADNANSTDSQSMTITSGHSIGISWAADTVANTLSCSASSSLSGSPWNWGIPGYAGTSISPNLVWSSSVTDTPNAPTTYYVFCKSLTGGPALRTTVVVSPAIISAIHPALSLKMVNGTSAPVFSNANNTTPTPTATAMSIPLGTSVNISWAGDTLASPGNTLDPNKCNASTIQGSGNWHWGSPAYTGTSFANNIYSTAIIDTPLVPTTYYVSCASAVSGPVLQATIIVTPAAGVVPDSTLKVRVVENGNVTNTVISTASTVVSSNNASPVATPINIVQGHSVSISWAADKLPDTINPNQCWADVSTGSSTNPWVWGPPAYTGTSITPNLVWSTSIIDTPTVPTIYYVSCHTIGGPWITAGVLVTPVPPPVTSCQIPASAGGSLSGYAWSPNIGWINMNSLVYDASGNLTGYAWSPNVGWIQFGNLSGFPTNMTGSVLANAKIDSNGDLSGWARVWSMTYTAPDHESFEWASGWIDLSNTILGYHPHFNLSGTGTNLGLGSGYAWGSRVTGWVNFSGVTVAPCLNPIASVLIKVIDNSVATNITSVTASSPGTNPNTGALTLGSNNTGVKIFWGASNVDYASCTASSSTSSGWAWSNPSNHATLTLLGGPVNDIPTSTITYTVTCNSLGSNTPVTANIKVNITATDPRAPRLQLSPNVNNCGDDTNKFPVSWAGNNLDQAGQCTATYTPITMPLNGWNSSVAYSSSPTYVLFPTNPTNNPVTYTLTLDCPSATGINPSSASDTQSVIIQPARNCVVEPSITSFAGNSCVVTGTDGNSVSSNIYVTSSNMSSCDVIDAVHGSTVTIPSGNGTANVNVFVNSVFKLNCTGTNGTHYANSSFGNLHDVIIPWRDICVPTAPIIHPAPKFIER